MRTLPRLRATARFFPALALIFAACGGEPAPVGPPQPTETPSAAPAPPPPPPPTAAPSASASSAPVKAPPKQSSGRPAVTKSDPKEITDSFGSSPGAKLELGDKEVATLRIPEGALRQATNITFKLDARGKTHGPPIGKVYQLTANYPPAGTPVSVDSEGLPFLLELPAGPKKTANLAIGVEGDKGKVKWTVVVPKRIDDARNMAMFELPNLPSAWLHITVKAPTGGK